MKNLLQLAAILVSLCIGTELRADVQPSAPSDVPASTSTPAVTDSTQSVSAASLLPAGEALPDTTSLVARMAVSLIAVIAVIWGAVQVLKRFSPGGPGTSSNSRIRVLDRAYIAPKKSIYVVQVGSKALALGVSDQQITNLTDLDLEETLADYETQASPGVTRRFTDVFKTVNARLTRHTEEPAT